MQTPSPLISGYIGVLVLRNTQRMQKQFYACQRLFVDMLSRFSKWILNPMRHTGIYVYVYKCINYIQIYVQYSFKFIYI